jgi:hypothetical protein
MTVPDWALLPDWLKPLVHELTQEGLPAYSQLSEEELSIPPTFAEETSFKPIEGPEDHFAPVEVGDSPEGIQFEAFLDGVQRTVLWRRIPLPSGALVPIHIAHIAGGVLLRTPDGQLFTHRDLIASRLLLLGPFAGIKDANAHLKQVPLVGMWDTDSRVFGFPQENEWVLCDTTFLGTEEGREKQTKDTLTGDILFNEAKIRSRAQGRVATLRQRLEFAVLSQYRSKHPEEWVLVDGPLFFIDKWRKRATKILGGSLGDTNEGTFENKLLYKAVGLIKSQRLRPPKPDQVLQIGPNQRSLVSPVEHEVDIKGLRDTPDEEGAYGGIHLGWYTRLRGRPQPPYGILGLIRLDVHRATLGLLRADHLGPDNFESLRPKIDAITRATWRERWPAFRRVDDLKTAAEPYPIQQVERVLKATLLPRRLLGYFATEPGIQARS